MDIQEYIKTFDLLNISYSQDVPCYKKIERIAELQRVKKSKRTITYLHSLWKKVTQRVSKRQQLIRKFIEERIINTVEPNEKGEYVIFFDLNYDIFKYAIKWDNEYQSYSWFTLRLKGTDRNSKIDILTVDTTLGNEFYYIESRLQSNFGNKVFKMMWGEIQNWLRENHKLTPMQFNGIIRVKLEDTIYLVSFNKQNKYYVSYEWVGKEDCTLFEINN
jgi:hypothetical protein